MTATEKDALVGDALRALLYEVSVNPKPVVSRSRFQRPASRYGRSHLY